MESKVQFTYTLPAARPAAEPDPTGPKQPAEGDTFSDVSGTTPEYMARHFSRETLAEHAMIAHRRGMKQRQVDFWRACLFVKDEQG